MNQLTTSTNHNDVMCGRGCGATKSTGNTTFCQLVQACELNCINDKNEDKAFITGPIEDLVPKHY